MNDLSENFVEIHHDGEAHERYGRRAMISFVTSPREKGDVLEWIDDLAVEGTRGVDAFMLLARSIRMYYESISEWIGIEPSDHRVFMGNAVGSCTIPMTMKSDSGNPISPSDILSTILISIIERDVLIDGKKPLNKSINMELLKKVIHENASYVLSFLARSKDGDEGDPALPF